MHMHDGKFELKSKLREGTEVIATFPRSRVLEVMRPVQSAVEDAREKRRSGAADAPARANLAGRNAGSGPSGCRKDPRRLRPCRSSRFSVLRGTLTPAFTMRDMRGIEIVRFQKEADPPAGLVAD